MNPTTILTLNSGSSSLRMDLFAVAKRIRRVDGARLTPPPDVDRAAADELLRRNGMVDVDAVVHRVVHGGATLTASCLVDRNVEDEIERLGSLAPLHNPVALAWIRELRDAWGGDVPQIAAFDTAFFADLPAAASSYALPWQLSERHDIRRYGFHGLAHRAMWGSWPGRKADGRAISIQLGAGCSMTATVGGRAVDTSMGFSPLEGLVMSTRCGDLDPGILCYLMREAGSSVDSLDSMLNDGAGLLGLSGLSGDMKALLASDEPRAAHAVSVFCHRVRKYLGAYLAVLGGADAVLFGGGIGEHAPVIRARALEGLGWAGIRLDGEANARAVGGEVASIHAEGSTVEVWVVPVDEAGLLVREALSVLRGRDLRLAERGGQPVGIPGGER